MPWCPPFAAVSARSPRLTRDVGPVPCSGSGAPLGNTLRRNFRDTTLTAESENPRSTCVRLLRALIILLIVAAVILIAVLAGGSLLSLDWKRQHRAEAA